MFTYESDNLMNMKKCFECEEEKEISEFYKNKARYDGLCNRCKLCDKTNKKDPKIKIARKLWEENNKDSVKKYHKEYSKIYYSENKEKIDIINKKWRENNKERWLELGRKAFQNPVRKHKHKINEAKRRALKLKATLPGFDLEISKIYDDCPTGYHVDHIVPLRGKDVCGLHVPWNLQYLTPEENRKKNNKTILR